MSRTCKVTPDLIDCVNENPRPIIQLSAADRCVNKWVKRWQKNKKKIDGKYGSFLRNELAENAVIYEFIKDLQRLTK